MDATTALASVDVARSACRGTAAVSCLRRAVGRPALARKGRLAIPSWSALPSARAAAAATRNPMDYGALIEAYGYWVVAVGCLLEGETLLVLGGFAASRGHLDFAAVIAVAAASGFAGDQIFYWIGRRHAAAALARFPSVAAQTGRVRRLIERFDLWVIVGVRFAYGLRVAGPILIGTSSIGPLRFAAFNALGALLWASVIAGVGYVFGETARALVGELHDVEGWLLLGLLGVAIVVFFVRRARARRRSVNPPVDSP